MRPHDIDLSLPAEAESLGLVRDAVAGFAENFSIDEDTRADMLLAVSEACSNVIVHAYSGAETPGPLEVCGDHDLAGGAVTITVSDQGRGIRTPLSATSPAGRGLGLGLIAELSDAYEIAGGRDGTEVRMHFHLSGRRAAA